jgi:predicted KAP-like P-loop ATPase
MGLVDAIGEIDLEDVAEVAARALDLIGTLAGSATAETAADIVVLIQNIYKATLDAAENQISPEEAHKALEQFENQIAASDKAADAALDAKFGPGQDVDGADSEE